MSEIALFIDAVIQKPDDHLTTIHDFDKDDLSSLEEEKLQT